MAGTFPSVREASVTAMVRAMPQEITAKPPGNFSKPDSRRAPSYERVYTLGYQENRRKATRLAEPRASVVTRPAAGYICVMFGIGGEEIIIIGLIFLIVFGPSKLPQMARDLGRFVNEARRSMDEFKDELVSDDDEDEDRHPKRKR